MLTANFQKILLATFFCKKNLSIRLDLPPLKAVYIKFYQKISSLNDFVAKQSFLIHSQQMSHTEYIYKVRSFGIVDLKSSQTKCQLSPTSLSESGNNIIS